MLNIMLMRDIESPIFDATRRWLDADETNVFHLVVDELHTYRGTPGTEVGYILRVLYRRLGLHPDHPQLRILASSASLGDDEGRAQDYLRQFFGRSRAFRLIRGGFRPIAPNSISRLRNLADPLEALGQKVATGADAEIPGSIDHLAQSAGLPAPPDMPTPQRLGAILKSIGASDAIRAACNGGTDEQPTIVPRTLRELGSALFPDATQEKASMPSRHRMVRTGFRARMKP
jgi:hypothetical protein